MTWTSPRTWVTGEVVTAAQLNIDIKQNISHLGGMLRGGVALSAIATATELFDFDIDNAQITADVAMSSGTYAAVTGLSITKSPVLPNFMLAILAVQHQQSGGGNSDVKLARSSGSGGTFTQLTSPVTNSGVTNNHTVMGYLTGHSAGVSQTIRAEQHTDGTGTSTVKRGHLIVVSL